MGQHRVFKYAKFFQKMIGNGSCMLHKFTTVAITNVNWDIYLEKRLGRQRVVSSSFHPLVLFQPFVEGTCNFNLDLSRCGYNSTGDRCALSVGAAASASLASYRRTCSSSTDAGSEFATPTTSACIVSAACLYQQIIQIIMGRGPNIAPRFRARNRGA